MFTRKTHQIVHVYHVGLDVIAPKGNAVQPPPYPSQHAPQRSGQGVHDGDKKRSSLGAMTAPNVSGKQQTNTGRAQPFGKRRTAQAAERDPLKPGVRRKQNGGAAGPPRETQTRYRDRADAATFRQQANLYPQVLVFHHVTPTTDQRQELLAPNGRITLLTCIPSFRR